MGDIGHANHRQDGRDRCQDCEAEIDPGDLVVRLGHLREVRVLDLEGQVAENLREEKPGRNRRELQPECKRGPALLRLDGQVVGIVGEPERRQQAHRELQAQVDVQYEQVGLARQAADRDLEGQRDGRAERQQYLEADAGERADPDGKEDGCDEEHGLEHAAVDAREGQLVRRLVHAV